MNWSKYTIASIAISCLFTWYILKFDGLLPTIIAVAIGAFLGQIIESLKGGRK